MTKDRKKSLLLSDFFVIEINSFLFLLKKNKKINKIKINTNILFISMCGYSLKTTVLHLLIKKINHIKTINT